MRDGNLRAFIGGENSGYWLAPDGQNYEVITQLPRASRTMLDDVANLNIATGRTMPDGTPEGVKRTAQDAIGAIQSNLAMWSGVQNVWYGLSLGSVLLLGERPTAADAVGFALIFAAAACVLLPARRG